MMAHTVKQCNGIRNNTKVEQRAPPFSGKDDLISSLVSALDSMFSALFQLNAEVACIALHEETIFMLGTEKGRSFLKKRQELQTDFQKFCYSTVTVNPGAVNCHLPSTTQGGAQNGCWNHLNELRSHVTTQEETEGQNGVGRSFSDGGGSQGADYDLISCAQRSVSSDKDVAGIELSGPSVKQQGAAQESEDIKTQKDCGRCEQKSSPEPVSDVYLLRKMVEEVFDMLYNEAAGNSIPVPVPYDKLLMEPDSFQVHGLPEGVTFCRPAEYDAKTLMKILEQNHWIRFIMKRSTDEPLRELNCIGSLNCVSSAGKTSRSLPLQNNQVVEKAHSPPTTHMTTCLYNLPVTTPGSVEPKQEVPVNVHSAAENSEAQNSRPSTHQKPSDVEDYRDSGHSPSVSGNHGPLIQNVHVSKRLLFSIVHDKTDKWDTFIKETEDINTLRECVQILFNSRYAEALGLDHMVPVPYRKIACDPEAVEIHGIPDNILFKRPCTYGVPKLKRIMEERHNISFVIKRMFDDRSFSGSKVGKETGTQEHSSHLEDLPLEPNEVLPLDSSATLQVSRSQKNSPLREGDPGTSVELNCARQIKTEPDEADIIQVTIPDPSGSKLEDAKEPVPNYAEQISTESAEYLQETSAGSDGILEEDGRLDEKQLEESLIDTLCCLREQVDRLFSVKYANAMGFHQPVKVPYSKFLMYPEDLQVKGLPEGVSFRRPRCFGIAKLRRILDVSNQIQFFIKRPELLTEGPKESVPENVGPGVTHESSCHDLIVEDPKKRQGSYQDNFDPKLSRFDIANTLREQVQDLFNRKYGEALGIKYPVQVPYKRIKSNPGSVIIEGLPPGIPFRKPCTFGSQNLERILAVADRIKFTVNRPFQGLIPKPAPRRITSLEKAYAALHEDEESNRLGEKVILREQVKELFNEKYGEALNLNRPALVPYRLIRDNPDSIEVTGLPEDVPFRNPNTYDIGRLEKVLQARDQLRITIKSPLQAFSEISSESTKTTNDFIQRRKRKRVSEDSDVQPSSSSTTSSSSCLPPNMDSNSAVSQIPVLQWPMYMLDYGGVNMPISRPVNY
ncbi:general transcription factor II-I repeat domain-containing protein 1 [Protopterus annectens]|uniref:general transcription factor II-I repeat domain-containing protein 1 n=1 Tax=Protopterus annectens TaxID=7888 RepID=UPI001CF9BCB6|nr:general transcription factor II-I repeat domain-containing protein 1 [Protopterus annectens]